MWRLYDKLNILASSDFIIWIRDCLQTIDNLHVDVEMSMKMAIMMAGMVSSEIWLITDVDQTIEKATWPKDSIFSLGRIDSLT